MGDLWAALAPFALAGALLPTWTVFVIVLLGTDHPAANAIGFIAGNATFRAAVGVAALIWLDIPNVPGPADELSFGQAVGMALGAALALALGIAQSRRPDDPDRPLPAWMRRFERIRPQTAFGLGVLTVASPGIQWAYLLGGVALIQQHATDPVSRLASLAGFVLSVQVMLVAPVVLYAVRPHRAREALDDMKCWLNAHTNRVSAVALLLVAAYLATRSAAAFLG